MPISAHTKKLFASGGFISFGEEATQKSLRSPTLKQALLAFCKPAPVIPIFLDLLQMFP